MHILQTILDLWRAHPVAQTIGFLGMLLGWASFHGRTPRTILRLQSGGSLFWTIHFILLAAPAGAFLNFLSIFRNEIYARRPTRRWAASMAWPIGFAAVCLGASAVTAATKEGPISLLSGIAQALACFSLLSTRPQRIRLLSIPVSLLWLLYDALSGSIPGTFCECVNQISIYIALFRGCSQARKRVS